MQVQASPEPPLGGGSTAAGLALKATRLVWRWGTETVVTLPVGYAIGGVGGAAAARGGPWGEEGESIFFPL